MKLKMSTAAAGMLFASGIDVQAADLQVIDIKAYLFLEKTGTLSSNIIGRKHFFFNSIIGEGDAGEPANDVLSTSS